MKWGALPVLRPPSRERYSDAELWWKDASPLSRLAALLLFGWSLRQAAPQPAGEQAVDGGGQEGNPGVSGDGWTATDLCGTPRGRAEEDVPPVPEGASGATAEPQPDCRDPGLC